MYEAELAFYTELDALQKERDAAFAKREKDPDRWQNAKHAYRQWATQIRELDGRASTAEAVAHPETAQVGMNAEGTGGN